MCKLSHVLQIIRPFAITWTQHLLVLPDGAARDSHIPSVHWLKELRSVVPVLQQLDIADQPEVCAIAVRNDDSDANCSSWHVR